LAKDPRYVGGQIGLVGVLHTWTRNLLYHPHVHYLAPGGGLGVNGQTWLPAHNHFFLPVRALSKLFRAAFRRGLKNTPLLAQIPAKVWSKDWVVHCKPVGNGQAALKYLAPYIHRVAISNRRLISIEHRGNMETSLLTFQYRASDTGQLKQCTLSVESFLQRFLQHILPHGFVKVRYYGFFGATQRQKLNFLQNQLGMSVSSQENETQEQATPTEPRHRVLCPKCGHPMFVQRNLLPNMSLSP
jgi:hypothetical protein